MMAGTAQDEQVELQVICSDDRVAVVQLRANMLQGNDRLEVIHGIVRDVTAEKQLTMQLVQADRSASVGALIAGVAHEINNPLTAICGYMDLLEQEKREGTDAIAIRTIAEEAARCRGVARNLLNLAYQSDSQRSEFDFNALARGVLDLRAYDLRSANISIRLDLEAGLPPVVAE